MDRDAKRDASAFRVLLDLSEEAKLPVDQLLAGIDVDRDSIYQPYAEIFMWQELAYIERLVERHVRFSLALTAASRVHNDIRHARICNAVEPQYFSRTASVSRLSLNFSVDMRSRRATA